MFQASACDVAYSMIRLWGRSATAVAQGYVCRRAQSGNFEAAKGWFGVRVLIEKIGNEDASGSAH
jgi:hypothetical protein